MKGIKNTQLSITAWFLREHCLLGTNYSFNLDHILALLNERTGDLVDRRTPGRTQLTRILEHIGFRLVRIKHSADRPVVTSVTGVYPLDATPVMLAQYDDVPIIRNYIPAPEMESYILLPIVGDGWQRTPDDLRRLYRRGGIDAVLDDMPVLGSRVRIDNELEALRLAVIGTRDGSAYGCFLHHRHKRYRRLADLGLVQLEHGGGFVRPTALGLTLADLLDGVVDAVERLYRHDGTRRSRPVKAERDGVVDAVVSR